MRAANLIVSIVGLLAAAVALAVSWRWRRGPTVATPVEVIPARRRALVDSLQVVASVLSATTIAGILVPGLVGRLLMRILGATSGDSAQGRLTEADEIVGEITLSGSLGFVLFVGLAVPLASSILYLAIRRVLPGTAWVAGLVWGAVLLALFGVTDPLSPDNVDFEILRPLPLAVALIAATALLYGTTFVALAARFERALRAADGRWTRRLPYLGLGWVAIPFFGVIVLPYVLIRTFSRGRLGVMVDGAFGSRSRRAALAAGTVAASAVVLLAAGQILAT